MTKCRKCHKEIPDGSAYCNHCGCKQEITHTRKSRGNKQGTAIKRGKTWTAVWSKPRYVAPDGSVRYPRGWKGGFATKREALLYAANPPQSAALKTPTLREYYTSWSASSMPKLSASKQTAYQIAWKRLAALYDIPVSNISIGMLQAQVDTEASTYYPARDMKTLLSHLLKRAVAEGYTNTNLSEYIELPKLEEKEAVPFSTEEIRKMWDAYASGNTFFGYPLLMIYTGMMPGELLRLKKSMIHFEDCEIVGIGIKTKKRKEAIMAFPEIIAPVLEDLCNKSGSKTDSVLWMNKDRFYEVYHRELVSIGVRDLPPYSCRHTTATALANLDIAPYTIQEIMRHTQFATTRRYIHQNTEDKHRALNKMGFGTASKNS